MEKIEGKPWFERNCQRAQIKETVDENSLHFIQRKLYELASEYYR
jgi:hypothetical protein